MRLKNYANELLTPKNITCLFEIDIDVSQKITLPEVRKNILLITKEAMNNIAKYSEANKALIKLVLQNETLLLSIIDNGNGFDATTIKQGNGLQHIQQRCKQLNGTCTIFSNAGKGTAITCSLPIAIISHT